MAKRGRVKEQVDPEPVRQKKRLSIEEQRQRALQYRERLLRERAAEREEENSNHIVAPKHGRSKSPPRSVKKSRVVTDPSVTSDNDEVESEVASSNGEAHFEDVQKILFVDEDTQRVPTTRNRRRETLLLPPSPPSSSEATMRRRRGTRSKMTSSTETVITRGSSRRKSMPSLASSVDNVGSGDVATGPFTHKTRQSLPGAKSQPSQYNKRIVHEDERTSSSSGGESESEVSVDPSPPKAAESQEKTAPSEPALKVHHSEDPAPAATITLSGFIMSLFFVLLPAALGYVSIAHPHLAEPVVAQLHQSHFVLKRQLEATLEKISAVFLISVAVAVITLLLYILYRVYMTYSRYKKKHDDIVFELTHAAKSVLRSKIVDGGYSSYPIAFVMDELIDRAAHNAASIKKLWTDVEKEIAKDSRIVITTSVFEGKSRRCWCMQGISKAEKPTAAEPVGNTVSFL